MSKTRRTVASVTAFLLALLWLPLLAGSAAAAEPVITQDTTVNGCNGVLPTPGSENTTKRLDPAFPSDVNPGGVVGYVIDYPVDPSEVGQTFRITDCVFVGDTAVAKYFVDFVPNNTEFQLRFSVPIPADTDLGSQFCNYAKTTGAPSASQASNRKAGPACFTVGGALRIEKRAGSESGPLLPGASFSVVCSPATAQPPTIVTGLSNPSAPTGSGTVTASGVATTGTIAIVGPSGTPCTVTETAAPDGYVVDPAPRHLTIPVGTSQAVEVFVNQRLSSLTVAKTAVAGGGTFSFAVTCDDGRTYPPFDLTVAAGATVERLVSDQIRVGTVCTVTETASPLFTTVRNPANGTVTVDADGATVAFTNTRRTGDLVVHKVADMDGTFTFDVDCTDDAFDTVLQITTKGGTGVARLAGVPTTVTCTVTERQNLLFSSFVAPPGGVVTIAAGDNDVWFTNTRLRGDLVVAKTADVDGTFTFDVDCTDDAYDRAGLSITTAGRTGSAEVAGIPTGVVCTVTERASPHWTSTVVPADGTVTIDAGDNPVAFANVRNRGALVIAKTSDLDGTFSFDVDCTDDAFDADGVTITTENGTGTLTINGIPTGVACTVTEHADPAWTHTVTPAGGTVTIGLGARTVAFENTRVRGALLVTKATDEDGPFHFVVDCAGTEHDGSLRITTVNGTGSASIADIPTGVVCTVTELPDPRFTSTVVPADGVVTIVAGGATVAFTNVRKTGSLVVTKAVQDATASGPAVFDFLLSCGLGGPTATFRLGTWPGESLVHRVDGIPTGTVCTVSEAEAAGWRTVVMPHDGTVTIGDTVQTVHFLNTKLFTDVHVVKSSDPPAGTAVTDGALITYTLTYVNYGNTAAQLTLTDEIPEGTTFMPGSAGDAVLDGRTLRWRRAANPGTLPGSVSFQVTVNSGLPDPTTIRNIGFFDEGDGALRPTNQVSHPVAHLMIRKAVDEIGVNEDELITYTIDVWNPSAATLTGISVRDAVPVNSTFESSPDGACNATCTVVSWPEFDLVPGSARRFTFVVRANKLPRPLTQPLPRVLILNTAVADAAELPPVRSNEVQTSVSAVFSSEKRFERELPQTGQPVSHALALALALLVGGGGLQFAGSWREHLARPGSR